MKKLLVALTATTALTLGGLTANAEVSSTEGIDEMWGSPTFIYGSALSKEQLDETKKILDITDKSLEESSVNGEDMVKFLGNGNPKANMLSSALITHNDKTENVTVEIVTPENITKVTQNQYSNALITAGAVNVDVKVASPIKVTGESALTGIYKAYEVNGVELDSDRMAVAQEELSTVTDIADANKDTEGFNEESLNKAVIDVKNKMAELSDGGNVEVKEAVANEAVNAILKANGLDGFVSEEQVASLVDFASAYAKTGAVSSEAVNSQLNDLASSVTEKANELKDLGSSLKDKAEDTGFFERVKGAFASMLDSIKSFF